jgi:hypothetical protein
MLWFKPDWNADFRGQLGRILWDVRIEHGSIVPEDPSQRYALVFCSARRKDNLRQRWRGALATNRNTRVIGTKRRRPDKRTRQAVFSSRQHFKAGQWLHLALTWNAKIGTIYVDGKDAGCAVLYEGLPTRPLPEKMQIGAVPSWINAGAEGVISEFRIYDRALEEGQIAQLALDQANAAL